VSSAAATRSTAPKSISTPSRFLTFVVGREESLSATIFPVDLATGDRKALRQLYPPECRGSPVIGKTASAVDRGGSEAEGLQIGQDAPVEREDRESGEHLREFQSG